MMIVIAGAWGTAAGLILGLAGLSTAVLCLFAVADGSVRRGLGGLVVGLGCTTLGLWLAGLL